MTYFLILLLIAGAVMPFAFQVLAKYILKLRGLPAWLGAVLVDLVLACVVIAVASAFTVLNVIGATILIFCVAHVFYDSFVNKYLPGRGRV